MELWFFIVLMIQSSLQSLFLVCYFRTDHRFRKWMILVFVFAVLLYPVNQYLLTDNVLLRNIVNIAVLYLACSVLFREETWKNRITGIILYELVLVGGEFIGISTSYFIFGMPPDFLESSSDLIFLYYYGCVVMLVVMLIVLRIFSRGLTSSDRVNFFLFSLLVNVILSAIAWFITVIPVYRQIYSFDYPTIFILLAGINLYTAASLVRFARRESQALAQKRIESAYLDQIESYLKTEEQEENLHRLRHDLINFSQSAKQIQVSDSADFTDRT